MWINHLDRMMAKNKTFCIINRNDIDTRKEFGKYGMSM
jgi:hypothetical protein